MNVKISVNPVFWNTLTDNKPSKQYLDLFANQMQDLDIQVNQLDYYHINIVCNRTDITYIQTNHNNHIQYWFFKRINKILPNGYVLEFELDIYATYTLAFLENLRTKNVWVHLVRSHRFNEDSIYVQDELLDKVPLFNTGVSHIRIGQKNSEGGKYYFTQDKKCGIRYPVANGRATGYLYYAFIDNIYADNLRLFPVMSNSIVYDPTTDYAPVWFQNSLEYSIHNSKLVLNQLRYENDYNNRYLGIFMFPTLFCFNDFRGEVVSHTFTNSNPQITGKRYLLSFTIDPTGEYFSSNLKIDGFTAKKLSEQVDFNDPIPHRLILRYMQYKVFGQDIDATVYYNESNNWIELSNWFMGISQYSFIKPYSNNNTDPFIKDYYNSSAVIEIGARVSETIDEFKRYLENTKYSRDNQLNIWKQQFLWNTSTSLISNGFNIGSIHSADNPAFASLNLATNTIFSLGNQILGYSNKVSTMNAYLKDMKNSTINTFSSGTTQDNCNVDLQANLGFENPSYFVCEKLLLTRSTIRSLNNILYFYGHSCNIIDAFSTFFVRSDFNYFLFDKSYLQNIFTNHILPFTPVEIYNHIINTLSEGVRLWNIQPSN